MILIIMASAKWMIDPPVSNSSFLLLTRNHLTENTYLFSFNFKYSEIVMISLTNDYCLIWILNKNIKIYDLCLPATAQVLERRYYLILILIRQDLYCNLIETKLVDIWDGTETPRHTELYTKVWET